MANICLVGDGIAELSHHWEVMRLHLLYNHLRSASLLHLFARASYLGESEVLKDYTEVQILDTPNSGGLDSLYLHVVVYHL